MTQPQPEEPPRQPPLPVSEPCTGEMTPSPIPAQRYNYWELPGETPRLYERLGVRAYKRYMPTTGDFLRNRFGFRPGGLNGSDHRARLESLVKFSKDSEAIHLGLTALIGAEHAVIANSINNSPYVHVMFGAIQVGVNAYPIFVQRYNRLRALRILRHILPQQPHRRSDD